MSSATKEASAPATEVKVDDASEVTPIGKILAQRRLYGRRIGSYKSTSKRMVESISKLNQKLSESEDDATKAELRSAISKKTYGLYRNYVISFNALTMGKDDDKRVVPTTIARDLKAVLTDSVFEKFEAVLKVQKEDLEKELPKEIESKVVEDLKKYVEEHEKDHFVAKYEETLSQLEKEIEARKGEIKPKKSPKSPKSSSSKGNAKDKGAEDLLQDCLDQVKRRVSGLRFTKNDFEYYPDFVWQHSRPCVS